MIQISYSLLFGSSTEQLGDSRRGKEAFIDCDLSLSVISDCDLYCARAREGVNLVFRLLLNVLLRASSLAACWQS